MLSALRRRLGMKIFLSYLVIILIGVLVLALSAEFVIPSAFDNHMSGMMGSRMMEMMEGICAPIYTTASATQSMKP